MFDSKKYALGKPILSTTAEPLLVCSAIRQMLPCEAEPAAGAAGLLDSATEIPK
jgi:hypothetical protein